MRDVDVPARPGGFVDLTRVEPALRHAATIWLVQGIEVLQDGRALPPGRLEGVRLSCRRIARSRTSRRRVPDRQPAARPRHASDVGTRARSTRASSTRSTIPAGGSRGAPTSAGSASA
jgi:hypothetical protein